MSRLYSSSELDYRAPIKPLFFYSYSNKVSSTTDFYDQQKNFDASNECSDISDTPSSSPESSGPYDSSDDQSNSKTLVSEQPRLNKQSMKKLMHKQKKLKKLKPNKRKILNGLSQVDNKQRKHSGRQTYTFDGSKSTTSWSSFNGDPNSPSNVMRPRPIKPPCPKQHETTTMPPDILYVSKPNQLWTNIDQSFGPRGPPNTTCPLFDALKSVRAFFSTSGDYKGSQPKMVEPQTYSPKVGKTFIDQTEFLEEQAAILQGRNDTPPPNVYRRDTETITGNPYVRTTNSAVGLSWPAAHPISETSYEASTSGSRNGHPMQRAFSETPFGFYPYQNQSNFASVNDINRNTLLYSDHSNYFNTTEFL